MKIWKSIIRMMSIIICIYINKSILSCGLEIVLVDLPHGRCLKDSTPVRVLELNKCLQFNIVLFVAYTGCGHRIF